MHKLNAILNQFTSIVRPFAVENVGLETALGRWIAEDIRTPIAWPPFNRSLRDGYALLARSTIEASRSNPLILTVKEVIPAGSVSQKPVEESDAVRILTGAPVPRFFDSVVAFEEVETYGNQVFLTSPVNAGQHIRRKGTIIEAGEIVVARGTRLGPGEIEAIASAGYSGVKVYQQPKVSVLPVGSELVEPGEPLEKGRIYSSNGFLISAWIQVWGGVPRRLNCVRDNVEQIVRILEAERATSQILVTTGGTSRGDYDFAPTVLETLGATEIVRILPREEGGPFTGGIVNGQPVLCFSGSPKAAVRSAKIFLKPSLEKMLGSNLHSWD